MSHIYAQRKRVNDAAPKKETAPQPSMDALRSGAAQPTAEQKGHRVDLPEAIRSKMESAFGADLSAVKLYESQAVADAGAEAVARGTEVAFAPGMLDFTSFGGQALLGHELSHVVSQSRGEVTGGGFLNDHALEARADREGAMAAAGQQIAMPTASLSSVTAAPSAAPMQAKKRSSKELAAQWGVDPKELTMKEKMNFKFEQMGYHGGLIGKLGDLGGQMLYGRPDKKKQEPNVIRVLPESPEAQMYNMQQYMMQQQQQPQPQEQFDPDAYDAEMARQVAALGGPKGSPELARLAAQGYEQGQMATQIAALGGPKGSPMLAQLAAQGYDQGQMATQIAALGGPKGSPELAQMAAQGLEQGDMANQVAALGGPKRSKRSRRRAVRDF